MDPPAPAEQRRRVARQGSRSCRLRSVPTKPARPLLDFAERTAPSLCQPGAGGTLRLSLREPLREWKLPLPAPPQAGLLLCRPSPVPAGPLIPPPPRPPHFRPPGRAQGAQPLRPRPALFPEAAKRDGPEKRDRPFYVSGRTGWPVTAFRNHRTGRSPPPGTSCTRTCSSNQPGGTAHPGCSQPAFP